MFRRTLFALLLLASLLALLVSIQPVSQAQDARPLQGKKIYLGAVNGEVSLFDRNENGASRLAALLLRQGAELLIVNWDVPIPEDATLVMLTAPLVDYSGAQMAHLWTYISRGGNLLVLVEPGRAINASSAVMELLWDAFGIQLRQGMLINAAYLDPTTIRVPDAFVSNFAPPPNVQHPILNGLLPDQITMTSACPLQTESVVVNTIVTPLLMTVEQYYGEANLQAIPNGQVGLDIVSDLAAGQQVVAAAVVNQVTQARVVVLCDGDLIMNKSGFVTSPPGSDRFVFPESVRFVFNTIYWALEIDGSNPVFEFQPPAATATPTITPSPTPTFTPTPQGF